MTSPCTTKTDSIEFDTRVRRALVTENTGLRQSRRRHVTGRAVEALISAVAA